MTGKYLLSEILQIIDHHAAFKEMFSEEQLTKYRIVARRLSQNPSSRPFRVVFCGVFSSGKTSLINTLLSSDFQLPDGVNPVTKMVTRICRGDTVSCSYELNGKRIPLPQDYIASLIRGKKQLIFESNELIITMPSDIFKNHVELIDTPGFNDEMGGSLEQMSREAIYEADMAVMCCNSLQLGKIIERDLLQELDDLLGHFCLVVTRMDNLNTQEDYDAVLGQANRLMLHKGNDASVFASESSLVFPVVTCGMLKNTERFETYFQTLLADDDMKQRIQSSSDSKCLTLCLQEIQSVFDNIGLHLQEELAALTQKNKEAIQQQEWKAQAERMQFSNAVNAAKNAAALLSEERMRVFAQVIPTLQNPDTFQTQANQLTHGMINDLINDIAAYGQRAHIAEYSSVQIVLCREYFSHGFSVPSPIKRKIKQRGLLQRILTTLRGFASLRFQIDNGFDEVYDNYHQPAIQAVWNGPIQWVNGQWGAYLEHLRSGTQTPNFRGGYEQLIQEKQALLNQCKSVKQMLSNGLL